MALEAVNLSSRTRKRTNEHQEEDSTSEEEYLALCLLMLAQGNKSTIVASNNRVNDSLSYVCTVCNKSFTSHQALGGHKASHYRKSLTAISLEDRGAIDDVRGYKCCICYKVFSSGQALGGHKRRHYGSGSNSGGGGVGGESSDESQRESDLKLPAYLPKLSCKKSKFVLLSSQLRK